MLVELCHRICNFAPIEAVKNLLYIYIFFHNNHSLCLQCQKAAERRQKMTVLWQNSSPMVITVLTQTIEDKKMILLERWTVNAING